MNSTPVSGSLGSRVILSTIHQQAVYAPCPQTSRRFGTFINRKTALAALLAPALVAGTANAAEPGFYVGASGGQTTLKVDDFNIDDSDTAWKGYVGYNFLPWLGVEAGYVDLGGASDSSLGTNVDLDVTAWQGFLVGMVPMGPVDLFVKAGGASIKAEIDAGAFGNADDSDEYFAYGAGLAYNMGHWALARNTRPTTSTTSTICM